ncbi:MAG: hypothetical protein OEM81_04765 [Acidimicrobiia bacterium]|nr:hypothetical protein [Acidimicrobiia bacterium]MDH3397128.1 hypothetical protein [Acidimicrobiia bacterium]
MSPKAAIRTVVVGVVLLLLAPACSSGGNSTSTTLSSGLALPQGDELVQLDPADFTTTIDNPYWPMEPGTRWTYREVQPDGTESEVVVIVTTLTKEIANGITARVVRDTVTEDGAIIEDTIDWYAQDGQGNIWYLGEDTAEFEDGEIVSTSGSFEAGIDGALPGIIIPADPQPGMKYRQEYYTGEAEDNGEVLAIDEMADTPYGHFNDAILTKDTTPLESDVLEYKLYAKDVGPVLIIGVSGGGGPEELISVDRAPESAGTGPLGNPNP